MYVGSMPTSRLILALVTILTLAAPAAAHARGADFKASIRLEETIDVTGTARPEECYGEQTRVTQTVRVATRRPRVIDAYLYERGSLRGLVELGPSGSGYARLPGFGSVDRQVVTNWRNCLGSGEDRPAGCGTRSSSRWPIIIDRSLTRRGRFRGLLPRWDWPGRYSLDPLPNCGDAPSMPWENTYVRIPEPYLRISGRALVDRRTHRFDLSASRSWSYTDERGDVEGTWTRRGKLTLKRVRRFR